jgi:hypothetical protein
MSLAVLADHMASKGRGGDSMLIHMAPQEIAGLQALAVANGSSLTTNPDTGLPEALSLKKLLPAIIGFGLNYFVPGLGSAVGSALGTSAAVGTGVAVGGFEALRTGDLGKGISAGLGAYGGAGLSEGLMTAGSTEAGLSSAALNAELAQAQGLQEGLSSGDAFNKFLTSDANPAVSEALKNATPFERMSAGLDAAKAAPGTFLKDNFKYLAAGAAPILADQAVKSNLPTTTTRPGMITPYSFFNGQYVAGAPYQASPTRAAGGGLMGMDDGGYSPGQLDFTQRSEPVVRMADGGSTVRMAKGTPPKMLTDEQLYQASGLTGQAGWEAAAKARDAQNAALNTYNLTDNADVGANINKWIVDNPFATAADINNAIKTSGLTQDIVNPYLTANTNISDATRYALSHASEMPGAGGLAGMQSNIMKGFATPNLTQAQIDAEQARYGLSNADVQSPLSHGFQVATSDMGKAANYLATNPDVMAWINSAEGRDYMLKNPSFDASDIAYTHYQRYGAGEGRKWEDKPVVGDVVCGPGFTKSIDGKSCVPIKIVETFPPCPTGYHYDPTVRQCVPNIDATQTTTTNVTTPTDISTAASTALPVGVSGAGITTINPNGTITTRPDIPGIPEGGFTGMANLRDVYEKGGGSLGVNKNIFVPKTYKELEDRFKLTGGSKQAMDYLTGKTKYSPVPYTEDGQIAKSYAESVMKIPVASSSKMYIFKNGKYEVNPDYAIPTYDKDGKKSSNLTNADVKTFMDNKPSTDAFYTWATTNNLSPEQIALASGKPINEISKLFTGAKDLVGEDGKIDQTKVDEKTAKDIETNWDEAAYLAANPSVAEELRTGKSASGKPVLFTSGYDHYLKYGKDQGWKPTVKKAGGGLMAMARGGMSQQFDLGGYSDGGRLLRGPGDGVSDSIPATIGNKRPARLADGEFVVPARIVSELGNGSTEAGARKLYAMMDRVQKARRGTVGKGKVAKNSRSDKHLPA